MELVHIITDGVTYDLAKHLAGSIVVTLAITFIGKMTLKKLSKWKETVYFASAVFVAVLTILLFISPIHQGPQLAGGIQSVVTGGQNNDRDTIAVITMSIMNAGSMQTITKNWNVEALINGRKYNPSFILPAPTNFTFNMPDVTGSVPNAVAAMTYHGQDNLLQKAMSPIQPGGIVAGVLFVIFQGFTNKTYLKLGLIILSRMRTYSLRNMPLR